MHPTFQPRPRLPWSTGWRLLTLAAVVLWCGCTASRSPQPALASGAGGRSATLSGVRPSSSGTTTQVVITGSGPMQPLVQRLSQPDRLLIELPYTRLPVPWHQDAITVGDGRLKTIQTTHNPQTGVSMTLLLNTIRDYRVGVQSAPHRVIVELFGAETAVRPPRKTRLAGTGGHKRVARGKAPAMAPRHTPQLPAGQGPLIVIDPGHGGHDPGTQGVAGVLEKTVVLQIAHALRQRIREEMPHYRVMLTRNRDVFIPLGERARMANAAKARVFISIHANSSPNHEASGLEVWYLSFAASARAKQLAARENMLSEQQQSVLERILRDMQETDRINQSAVLAQTTHKATVEYLATHYPGLTPRRVEGAPFAVLHRTQMPSILVETGFLSNAAEEARLRTPQYQRLLVEGIVRGLQQFLHSAVVAMR